MGSIERAPKATRTKRGRGAGARLDVTIDHYRAADGVGPDYGTFHGRDEEGRWELHYANKEEMMSTFAQITGSLADEATNAREESIERDGIGTTAWLKAIGAQGDPADEMWWNQRGRDQWIDFPYRPKSVRPGDLMVIYAAGTGKLVGVARAISDWYEGGNQKRWPYRMNVELLARLPVSQGVDLNSVASDRELGKSIRQKSHVRLKDTEAESALSALGVSA
jgi:hypothetical protein